MSKRVLVGAPLVGNALERVRGLAEIEIAEDPIGYDRAELLARIGRADVLLAMPSQRIDEVLLSQAPRLGLVANHAVGIDNVDLGACRARGIIVTNTPGVLTEATADLAFGLILDACRRITEGDRIVRAGGFRGWGPTLYLGTRVHGAVLGVVGLGRIGRAVARRAMGFGMTVLYAAPRAAEDDTSGAQHVPLEELLARADVVSLHAPLRPETRGLMSRARLLSMKRGAVLVNTARGALVDEQALAEVLADGHLAAAGLDVYVDEPKVSPALLALPNVVLAPHVGSADPQTREAMAALACDAIVAMLTGRAPTHRVA